MPPRKSARSGAAAPAQPAKGTRGAAATATAVAAAAPVAREEDVEEKEDEEMEEEEEEERSAGEESSPSKNVRRSQRASRNAQDVPATSTKAERVTRSRTRKSRNESPEPSPTVEDEDEDSEPVVPKKRGAKRGPKGSPAKKRGRRPSGRRASTTSSKKKGRGGRRPRKRQSDEEEESEESELDLGESEEEEREEDGDDDDDYEGEKPKSKALPPATPGSRRSSRHAAPGSRVASVVLERMEGSTTSSRPTRGGRGARASQKKKQEDVVESGGDEIEEEEEVEKPAKRKPRSAAASKQQPPRRGRARTGQGRTRVAKAEAEEDDGEEEDEQEEDDAPETTEGSATTERDKTKNKSKNKGKDKKKENKKESKAPVKSDTNEDEDDGDKDDDDIPADKEEGDDEEGNDDDDSKMDVDTAEVKEEAKGAKRKLDLTEANLPPAKKTKTPDGDSNELSGSSSKSAADEPTDGTAKKDEGEKSGAETAGVKVVNGAESAPKPSEARPTDAEPKVNGEGEGDTEDASDVVSASIGAKVSRRVVSSASPKTAIETAASFSLVSYNLGSGEWVTRHDSLLEEVTALAPSILCLQGVDEGYFKSSLDSALKSDGYLGLYKAGNKAADQEAESVGARKQDAAASTRGLATFYLLSHFEIVHHAEFETRELLTKVVETSSLSDVEKETAKGLLARIVAPVLVTKLRAVPSGKCVTVANVELSPPSSSRCGAEDLDDSMLALQAAAVLREVLDLSDVSAGESHVVCGALGRLERGSIVRQLLERGRVDVDTLESLKTKAGGEQKHLSLVSLLENSFRHALPNLRSSYESVLGHELKCPDDKSPKDTVWISADSLHTKSVLDFAFPSTTADVHISLKADLSFVH